jgi:cobalt-zinc-cadmium efflux system membrane fusion protein
MKKFTLFDRKAAVAGGLVAAIVFATVLLKSGSGQPATTNSTIPAAATNAPPAAGSASNASPPEASVDLKPTQLAAIKIEPVGTHVFSVEKTALGSIDYDEDLAVQVFSSYQGKIITASANLGDEVQKGQPLYTIDSPDLIQAESTLIGAAAANVLYSNELVRARSLFGTNGVSEREMEQATSDEQTAEGALKAARDAVRVFGKSDAEIDQMVASRKIDPALVVPCPMTGRITSRNVQPGLLVQPGNVPAPYTVADLTTKWMVANVIESDSPSFHVGQPLTARVMAIPDQVFDGKISRLGSSVDPNTHRVMVRCDIADPKDQLRPGMLATFAIQVGTPEESLSIPVNGVVRNGDGTFAAWVTTNRQTFVQKIVKIGVQQDDQYQVLDGLKRGEMAVTDGAVFISNILYAPPSD